MSNQRTRILIISWNPENLSKTKKNVYRKPISRIFNTWAHLNYVRNSKVRISGVGESQKEKERKIKTL